MTVWRIASECVTRVECNRHTTMQTNRRASIYPSVTCSHCNFTFNCWFYMRQWFPTMAFLGIEPASFSLYILLFSLRSFHFVCNSHSVGSWTTARTLKRLPQWRSRALLLLNLWHFDNCHWDTDIPTMYRIQDEMSRRRINSLLESAKKQTNNVNSLQKNKDIKDEPRRRYSLIYLFLWLLY